MRPFSRGVTAALEARNSARVRQLFRFGVVGALGTAVYYAVLWGLVELLGVRVLVASSIAFLLVCVENYILHYLWTFGSAKAHTFAFPRFSLMTVIGFWINWAVMLIGVSRLAFNYLLVQAAAIALVITWNYTLSSYWIFRDSHNPNSATRDSIG